MPGVDGAVKLHSFNAPSVKNTETEKSVSAFAVAKKPKKLIEKAVEKTVEEFVKDLIEIPVEEFEKEEAETEVETEEIKAEPIIEVNEVTPEPIFEPIIEPIIKPIVEPTKTQKQKKKKFDIKGEFSKVKDIVFNMYEKVFNNTPSFKPTFDEVIGDLLLYLSKKLSIKNANGEFDLEFGLTETKLPEKYSLVYIPLSLKLSKWCKDKGVLDISEDLLFAITSVYLTSAKAVGVMITELDIAIDFDAEIKYCL